MIDFGMAEQGIAVRPKGYNPLWASPETYLLNIGSSLSDVFSLGSVLLWAMHPEVDLHPAPHAIVTKVLAAQNTPSTPESRSDIYDLIQDIGKTSDFSLFGFIFSGSPYLDAIPALKGEPRLRCALESTIEFELKNRPNPQELLKEFQSL